MFRLALMATAMVLIFDSPTQAGGGLGCLVLGVEQLESEEAYAQEQRALGPEALQIVLAEYDLIGSLASELHDRADAVDEPGADADGDLVARAVVARQRLARIIDHIAGQRGATASRLYWHTDLDQAKSAAKASGKPILSLRMLGKLTDELSCANSRLFRTALYTNKEISDYLRDNFVLHWQSVRPVPRITIDFGDGRRLERTLTGNSAHYLLDAAGCPLDALPGLYGPQAFRTWLAHSKALARRWADFGDDPHRRSFLAEHHASRLAEIDESLRADLASLAPGLLQDASAVAPTAVVDEKDPPTAVEAGLRAHSKGRIEMSLVAQVVPASVELQSQDDEFWRARGEAHADEAQLDSASVEAMRRENPDAVRAGGRAITKTGIESGLLRMVRDFEHSMAVDAVRNEYTLHRTIHEWFVAGTAGEDVDALNERVYAELFLTPSSDPWLGLAPAEVYTALDHGGRSATP